MGTYMVVAVNVSMSAEWPPDQVEIHAFENVLTEWTIIPERRATDLNQTDILPSAEDPCIRVDKDELGMHDVVISGKSRQFSQLTARINIQGINFDWNK